MSLTHRLFVVRPLLLLLLTIGITIGSATQARAQGFISPFFGLDFGGDAACPNLNSCENKRSNYGVALGKMGNLFGFEEEFAFAPDFFGEAPGLSSSVITLMSNIVLNPNLGPVRPYLLVGAGLIRTHVETLTSSNTDNNLGWDVGGGLTLFITPNVGLRGDLRYFHAFQDLSAGGFVLGDTKLDYGRGSVAVVFRF